MIPTFLPGPQPFLVRGEYRAIPPHSIGAAASEAMAPGILNTYVFFGVSITHTGCFLLSCDSSQEFGYFICSKNMARNSEERTEKNGNIPNYTYKVRGYPSVIGVASV